jgi:hypothetical protein
VAAGTASVRGGVTFAGAAPVMKEIPNSSCGAGHRNVTEETIVVSKGGGLKNCIVYVEGAPAYEGGAKLAAPLLDQVGCQYTPHVLGVVVNQPLRVHSADDTLHNVHYDPQANPPKNFAMVGAGQERTVAFKEAEIFKVTCDVHPWMTAWVGVFENPYFGVTGDDGSYQIDGLPAGTYKLVVWHERLGKQEQEITVGGDGPAVKDFVYKGAAPVAAGG